MRAPTCPSGPGASRASEDSKNSPCSTQAGRGGNSPVHREATPRPDATLMRRVGRAVWSSRRAREGATSSRSDSVLALELVELGLQLLGSGYELLANPKYEPERNGHQCKSDGVNHRRSHTDPPPGLGQPSRLATGAGSKPRSPLPFAASHIPLQRTGRTVYGCQMPVESELHKNGPHRGRYHAGRAVNPPHFTA